MTTGNAATRPNFFVLLGLNPNALWDQATFENALKIMQNEWSRQGNWVGNKALNAKKNLAFIPEIKRVMADEGLRALEAEAARAIVASERQLRFDAFEKRLGFIHAARSIEEADLNKLIDDFQDILSPSEVKARIMVPIISAPAVEKTVEQLDPTIAKKILDLLQLINMKTLYEALQLPKVTATPELYRVAEELYKAVVRRMPKTAEVTALTELAGLAMEVFKTEDTRQRYDESLRQGTIDSLLKEYDVLVSNTVKRKMEPEQVTLFLESAQKAGWKPEEALTKLEELSLQHKWILQAPGTVKPKVKCGNCERLNDQESKKCIQCGKDLYIACPNCNEIVASDQKACGNCGFAVGNRFLVDTRLEELQSQLDQQQRMIKIADLKEFNASLDEVEKAWRPNKPDERSQKIQSLKSRTHTIEQAKQQTQQHVAEELSKLIVQKRFLAAREWLSKRGEHLPEEERNERKLIIEEKIGEAQGLMAQARSQTLSKDDKIDVCRQALKVCADLKEAQELLETMPPSPPSNLRAQSGATVVSLSWNASPTSNVTYTIVRKVHARPNSAKDGKVVGTVTGLTFDDDAPIIGRPLYYAVFAGFDSVVSAQAAIMAQPVLLTQDVTSTTVQVDNQQVDLSWETPPNVHSVVVVRTTQSPPTSIREGQRVAENDARSKRVIDRDVQNGTLYYYGIFCQLEDHVGRLHQSVGKVVSATPEQPPVPIHHLTIESTKKDEQHFDITISWIHEGKGSVVVLKSEQPFPEQANKVLPESELNNYGEILQHQRTSVRDSWSKTGVAFYTPVILFQKMAYVGSSQRFACVDNISNLRQQNLGTAIRLHWKWPANCQEVLIAYRTDASPTSINDPHATLLRVNRAQYDNSGHYDLQGTSNQQYYMLISAIIDDNGTKVIAQGIAISALQIIKLELTYEIRLSGAFGIGRKRTLHIRVNALNGGHIPQLRLVGKQGRLPFRKTDGDLLQNIGPLLNDKKEQVIALPQRQFASGTYGKLFLEEDDKNDRVIIHHPSEEKLRLS